MVFCDKPNGVCRFFPIGSVKVDDQDFCVTVTIENVLTYDVSEPVVVAFEMGDDRGIARLGEDAVAAFRAFGFLTIYFGANACLPFICAGGCIADAPVFSAVPMSVNIFAASKEIAKEFQFVARWARTGDDSFDLCPSIERFASFLPFFQCCVTDVWTVAADDDLAVRLRYMGDGFLELE